MMQRRVQLMQNPSHGQDLLRSWTSQTLAIHANKINHHVITFLNQVSETLGA